MDLFSYELSAGEVKQWYGTGRYFRILKGAGKINIQVLYDGGNMLETSIITGIGVDLTHPDTGSPFRQIFFKSDITQTVEILVSAFPTSDSRLTGDVDINGALSVINAGGLTRVTRRVALVSGVAVELLPEDSDRLKSVLHFDVDVSLGSDATVTHLIDAATDGFPLSASSDWGDENINALFCMPSGDGFAYIMEDRK